VPALVRRIRVPLLAVGATADRDAGRGARLAAAAGAEALVVPGALHGSSLVALPRVRSRIEAFLARLAR
jgi:hypothetical protein